MHMQQYVYHSSTCWCYGYTRVHYTMKLPSNTFTKRNQLLFLFPFEPYSSNVFFSKFADHIETSDEQICFFFPLKYSKSISDLFDFKTKGTKKDFSFKNVRQQLYLRSAIKCIQYYVYCQDFLFFCVLFIYSTFLIFFFVNAPLGNETFLPPFRTNLRNGTEYD